MMTDSRKNDDEQTFNQLRPKILLFFFMYEYVSCAKVCVRVVNRKIKSMKNVRKIFSFKKFNKTNNK